MLKNNTEKEVYRVIDNIKFFIDKFSRIDNDENGVIRADKEVRDGMIITNLFPHLRKMLDEKNTTKIVEEYFDYSIKEKIKKITDIKNIEDDENIDRMLEEFLQDLVSKIEVCFLLVFKQKFMRV